MKRWKGEKMYTVLIDIYFAAFSLVWKVAPSLPRSRGIDSRSRRLRFGLESRTVTALVWKVALYSPWSGPSPLLSLKSRWQKKSSWSRRLRLGLKGHAASTLVWKVAPYPLRSRVIYSWSRRLRLGLKSRAVSALV